jgi:hypothetical protein
MEGHVEAVEALIAAKADVNFASEVGVNDEFQYPRAFL